MKKIAILQSNYIPWKGYFHIIQKVDHFVFLDTAQYTTRDWRNRNRIKTPEGLKWLTVPTNGTQSMKINKVKIDNSTDWRKKHLKTFEKNYKKCRYFKQYFELLQNILMRKSWKNLSDLNQLLIKEITKMLCIKTTFSDSKELELLEGKNEKIISIIQQLSGDHYITGPAARSYIDENIFSLNDIKVEFIDYSYYPVYNQPWGKFTHNVSILDLFFCEGPDSPKFIWKK
ncbi:MAG: WbqC family protein [Candidatus Cloacimonetes bacterium]|nr:WbqC family protein [Candidatus Cloacimonadota bacterium]MBL7148598.1 WbqC family protein [Candidatus Cloacimonadota bacterium]